jgi:hypothetical protein
MNPGSVCLRSFAASAETTGERGKPVLAPLALRQTQQAARGAALVSAVYINFTRVTQKR